MMWFVLGRDMHTLCVLSTDTIDGLSIDDSGENDGQSISITSGCAIGNYDFTISARHKDSRYIQEGNFISFVDKYGKYRLYTIMTVEGGDTWNVHCEDIGIDLINEMANKWDYTGNPKSIADTIQPMLNDSGWSIGINEISDRKRATKFDSDTDSILTRLGNVMTEFDAECDFEIKMKGSRVTKQIINIYKRIGSDNNPTTFIDNINLISLSRSGSIEELYTCIFPKGNQTSDGKTVNISNIEYDDGRYFTKKGDYRIYDREANKKWSRYKAYYMNVDESSTKGYINCHWSYGTDNAQELFNRALSELKKHNDISVSYTVELLDVNSDLGDTVRIADNSGQNGVYFSARIVEVRNHYSVNGSDTGVIDNQTTIKSKI